MLTSKTHHDELDELQKPPLAHQQRMSRTEAAKKVLEGQRVVLARLRAWHQWEVDNRKSLFKYILSKLGYLRRPRCPDDADLVSLGTYFFPPRSLLKVTVCDFGHERAVRSTASLGAIEEQWRSKPDWANVRWIHATVGMGLLQDTLGASFLDAPPGALDVPFHYESAPPAWHVLSLRDRQYVQDQLDVFNILGPMESVTQKLDEGIVDFFTRRKKTFLLPKKTEQGAHFWKIVHSDLSWQLDDPVRSGIFSMKVPKQSLSSYPPYSNALVVRDPFRCFTRDDGILLTMSSAQGVHYIGRDLSQNLGNPPTASVTTREGNPDYFVLERIWELLKSNHPACTWPKLNADQLLVLLVTELQTTPRLLQYETKPRMLQHERGMDSLQDAYESIVQELKQRRSVKFRRGESINLVREYIDCMDEVSQLISHSEHKIDALQRLRVHCRKNLAKHRPQAIESHADDPVATRVLTDRVDWAIQLIKEDHRKLPGLLAELKGSLDVLFQLRTIEQNELAFIAESNNKAILVFTIITIIFLPLSFFTSYFGMNLQGVANSHHTERYFWAVCGTITFVVVLVTVLFGFKERLYRRIWDDRE